MTQYTDPRLRLPAVGDMHHTKQSAAAMLRSGLYHGDIAQAAYAAQWMLSAKAGPAAWVELFNFSIDALCGEGIDRVVTLQQCWMNGHEDDNLYSALIQLCRRATEQPDPTRKVGALNREADELKCAVLFWYQDRMFMQDSYPAIVIDEVFRPTRLRKRRDDENKWYRSLAVSAVHKTLRSGDTEMCAYATGWLLKIEGWAMYAWRRLMAFPSEDLSGEGAARVAAIYSAWDFAKGFSPTANSYLFAAIVHLTELVTVGPARKVSGLDHRALIYYNSAVRWHKADLFMPPPAEAFDMHVGQGTVGDFWDYANPLGEASPWRADAIQMRHEPKKKSADVDRRTQTTLF